MKSHRIAYVQYTNPAGYPPLQHSSELLAENGWEVLFLGTGAWGAGSLRFPANDRIRVRQMRFQPAGWRQKVHYGLFQLWCLAWIIRWRPSWVYASELLSAPFAWFASAVLRIPVVFHEHDSPPPTASGVFGRFCLWMRRNCARRAALCVIPNGRRADEFAAVTRCPTAPLVIWNCPRRQEVAPARQARIAGMLRLLYHGSIVPDRLPVTVIEALAAMPDGVTLTVVGYETVGSQGYLDVLRGRAATLGIGHRLEIVGALVSRRELMEVCGRHDAGLALMPAGSGDPNLQAMTGASNKPFDYMACGLALVVSQLPDWEEMFVRPGYGLSCDPSSPQSIAGAVGWLYAHPQEARAMGELGRRRILEDWNYDIQFRPVLDRLSGNLARKAAGAASGSSVMSGQGTSK